MDVPFGDGRLSFSLPDCEVTVCTPPAHEPVDPHAAAAAAMADPQGPALEDVVASGDSVAIVVTDVTRATPDDVLLDHLFDALDRAGVDREQVTVVVGLGLHRPMSEDEIQSALGEYASLAINHDPDRVVEVGTVDECSIELFEPVAAADRVLSTGMVEPHQYAGFSGGAKTAVIGAGGESQIGYTHGPALLAAEGVRLGRVEANPFRDFLDRAGDVAGVDFCLNVSHGPEGVLGAAAGESRAVVRDLASRAREALAVSVRADYDAVIAGVGAPKDANLYQASRAATYLALGARDPLGEGGRIVIPAPLPEGAGEGTGERRFYDWLSNAEGAEACFEAMRGGYEPGAQRAFVLARVLRKHDVWITNSEAPAVVEACCMRAAPSVGRAVASGSSVLVVPDALDALLV